MKTQESNYNTKRRRTDRQCQRMAQRMSKLLRNAWPMPINMHHFAQGSPQTLVDKWWPKLYTWIRITPLTLPNRRIKQWQICCQAKNILEKVCGKRKQLSIYQEVLFMKTLKCHLCRKGHRSVISSCQTDLTDGQTRLGI